ncbi:hypothetical protein MBLNU457_1385t1 [Dothideomycetes sp. NU457]
MDRIFVIEIRLPRFRPVQAIFQLVRVATLLVRASINLFLIGFAGAVLREYWNIFPSAKIHVAVGRVVEDIALYVLEFVMDFVD